MSRQERGRRGDAVDRRRQVRVSGPHGTADATADPRFSAALPRGLENPYRPDYITPAKDMEHGEP